MSTTCGRQRKQCGWWRHAREAETGCALAARRMPRVSLPAARSQRRIASWIRTRPATHSIGIPASSPTDGSAACARFTGASAGPRRISTNRRSGSACRCSTAISATPTPTNSPSRSKTAVRRPGSSVCPSACPPSATTSPRATRAATLRSSRATSSPTAPKWSSARIATTPSSACTTATKTAPALPWPWRASTTPASSSAAARSCPAATRGGRSPSSTPTIPRPRPIRAR